RVLAGVEAMSGCFDSHQLDLFIALERVKYSNRIRSPANTGNDNRRQRSVALEHLVARLASDNRLELAHHPGIWRRSNDGPDDVAAVVDVRYPVADRFTCRVLERTRS